MKKLSNLFAKVIRLNKKTNNDRIWEVYLPFCKNDRKLIRTFYQLKVPNKNIHDDYTMGSYIESKTKIKIQL